MKEAAENGSGLYSLKEEKEREFGMFESPLPVLGKKNAPIASKAASAPIADDCIWTKLGSGPVVQPVQEDSSAQVPLNDYGLIPYFQNVLLPSGPVDSSASTSINIAGVLPGIGYGPSFSDLELHE